ncbi:MAG: LPS export ABC transporter periplasmic protein LptC [bacterium]|nr:LPS export ABC transporter periplasmic protein LptC [bacterium]
MEKIKKFLSIFRKLDKQKRGYLIVLLLIIAVLSWAFISAEIMTADFNRSQVEGKSDEQKVSASGIIITETKNGTKHFEIYGETGNYTNDSHVATLNNVVGNFYKDGEVAMSFQSSKGTYDETKNTIVLYNNTYIVLKDETSLLADKLTWSGSENDTIAEGNIKIQKGKEFMALADKCIICAGYNKFKIVGKTQTKIFDDKEKK